MVVPTVIVVAAALAVGIKSLRFAPPSTIHFVSGPDGSSYHNLAEKYQQVLLRYGVKVELLQSHGALDKLEKLGNRSIKADVGFVQGGLTDAKDSPHLVSLGSPSFADQLYALRDHVAAVRRRLDTEQA